MGRRAKCNRLIFLNPNLVIPDSFEAYFQWAFNLGFDCGETATRTVQIFLGLT